MVQLSTCIELTTCKYRYTQLLKCLPDLKLSTCFSSDDMTSFVHHASIWTLILLFLMELSLISSQNAPSKKESLCMTSSGQLGKCSRLLSCKTRRWMKPGRPDVCYTENGVVFICCPTELTPRRSKNVPVCGLSFVANSRAKRQVTLGSGDEYNESSDDVEGFIVGGRDAVLGQYPWMAILYSDGDVDRALPMCGASLITFDAVLTAAHCVDNSDYTWVVRLGEHKLSATDEGAHVREVRVKEVKIHEGYQPPSLYNDIAVLRLVQRVPLSSKLMPICLPVEHAGRTFAGETGIAAGWGSQEMSGPNADVLQEVNLTIVSNDHCDAAYKNISHEPMHNLPNGIGPEIVCAGDGTKVTDSCQGDSGGPLMVFDSAISRWIQVGIVSAGMYCDGGSPGLYARVTEYASWIQKAIL